MNPDPPLPRSLPRPAGPQPSTALQRGVLPVPPQRPQPSQPRSPAARLTVAEVATELRVSKMTVYRLIHNGELAAQRIGRSFRVLTTTLDEYLAELS